MNCPRCNVELKPTQSDGFAVIDVCSVCDGAWFEMGELDELDDSLRTDVENIEYRNVTAKHGALDCPQCDSKKLSAISPPDDDELVLDRCDDCGGFWLDEGELDHVRQLVFTNDSAETRDRKHHLRPPDWSWLKWRVYLFKQSMS